MLGKEGHQRVFAKLHMLLVLCCVSVFYEPGANFQIRESCYKLRNNSRLCDNRQGAAALSDQLRIFFVSKELSVFTGDFPNGSVGKMPPLMSPWDFHTRVSMTGEHQAWAGNLTYLGHGNALGAG